MQYEIPALVQWEMSDSLRGGGVFVDVNLGSGFPPGFMFFIEKQGSFLVQKTEIDFFISLTSKTVSGFVVKTRGYRRAFLVSWLGLGLAEGPWTLVKGAY